MINLEFFFRWGALPRFMLLVTYVRYKIDNNSKIKIIRKKTHAYKKFDQNDGHFLYFSRKKNYL